MLNEFLTLNVFGFFLILARVGSVLMLLPGFSANYVNIRTRILVALAVSFVLTPILSPALPDLPATPAGLGVLVSSEIIIGIFFGSLARIYMGALQTAGTLISYYSSLTNAFIQDPIAEQQSSIIASFMGTVGLLLVFVTDTHYLMLRAMVDSYSLFVPGAPLPIGDITQMIGRRVADSFMLGVQLSSPLLLTGLSYYIGLGLLSRLNPQLPVFFFGLPIQITMQIAVLGITLSGIMLVFLSGLEEYFAGFLAP